MGARGKRQGHTGGLGMGGRGLGESRGGLWPFHQWGHVCLWEEKKQGVVNDKLIGGICSPHGLVLTWRPDGQGMVCQLIRLCSAPHPLQELFRERKDLFKWAPSPSDCSRSSRSLTKAGFIFTDWDGRWHLLVAFLDIKEGMFQDKLWKDSATLSKQRVNCQNDQSWYPAGR